MKKERIIAAFDRLGSVLRLLGENKSWPGFECGITESEYEQLSQLINRQESYNSWFTKENVRKAMLALGNQCDKVQLENWLDSYSFNSNNPKKVAIIMAGNIPLVGFHDFLCVLMSGHSAVCKMSSDDKTLLPALVSVLNNFEPELETRISLSTGRIGDVNAVIATGSDNSLKYFEQYFGKYPHLFRANRTSVAVITGEETEEDFERLGRDIFDYFGLGCRNVSHLLVPENYKWEKFFKGIVNFGEIINHHKYCNNYDYNKTIYLMNRHNLLDNNFVLLFESEDLHSPLSMIHYHTFKEQKEIEEYLIGHESKIQAVVGRDYIPFGQAQCPALNDYADGVDTMFWLNSL